MKKTGWKNFRPVLREFYKRTAVTRRTKARAATNSAEPIVDQITGIELPLSMVGKEQRVRFKRLDEFCSSCLYFLRQVVEKNIPQLKDVSREYLL